MCYGYFSDCDLRRRRDRGYLERQETKAARSIPKAIWPVVRRKLDLLNRVARLDALRVPPGNEFKALKGAEAGFYQIRVNDQYRIRFSFREEHFHDVCCKDFH